VKSLLDRWISRTAEHLVVAMIKRGEPLTVVVSDADYQGYLETLEIMEDKEAQAAMAEGESDLHAGRIRDFDEIRRTPRVA
jgi:PHD/YefM family antitoxin component YafN of YafNO toxin-antitoxin module